MEVIRGAVELDPTSVVVFSKLTLTRNKSAHQQNNVLSSERASRSSAPAIDSPAMVATFCRISHRVYAVFMHSRILIRTRRRAEATAPDGSLQSCTSQRGVARSFRPAGNDDEERGD